MNICARPVHRRQIAQYVTAALHQSVLPGWRIRRRGEHLVWIIERVMIPPGEWPDQAYSLLISDDLQWFIFTHGNTDGGFWGPDHALMNAMVISASSLKLPRVSPDLPVELPRFELSQCVQFVMKQCKPNEWGYT